VAAKQLGRRYIGIEIDPKWARVARERVAEAERLPSNP
jgi:DNA modification methylase